MSETKQCKAQCDNIGYCGAINDCNKRVQRSKGFLIKLWSQHLFQSCSTHWVSLGPSKNSSDWDQNLF